MKKIFFKILVILIFSSFILISCGIDDGNTYIEEPKNVYITEKKDPNGLTEPLVIFSGYNQEMDGEVTLFIGYNIYYYFASNSILRKAMVRNPLIPNNNLLFPFPHDDPSDSERFPIADFPLTMTNFYQLVTFPVTKNMIDNILNKSSNDNVRFSFGCPQSSTDTNNFINIENGNPAVNQGAQVTGGSSNYVYLGSLYPNKDEYSGINLSSGTPNYFLGFHDSRYYAALGINPDSDGTYKVYFIVKSAAFRSAGERTQSSIEESTQSSVVTAHFKVQN